MAVRRTRVATKKRPSKTPVKERSLEAIIRTELAKPVIPGEVLLASEDIEAFVGRETKQLTVRKTADRPVQVGSHCHFFEVNRALRFDRPQAFAAHPGEAIFAIDDEGDDAALLGTGFALRLIRNLARELSGALIVEAETLTIRLPAAVTKSLEQVR